jgi:hypothetical protein
MSNRSTLDTPEMIADAVNEIFHSVEEEGFINRHNEPAMTTPTTVGIAEVVVVGSTICLIC